MLGRTPELSELTGRHVSIGTAGGANAAVKVPGIVAGMLAGADSINTEINN